MIKLIATDMDGTLLNDQNQLPTEFQEVYQALMEKGIIFGAASGRQYYNLIERFTDQKDDMLFIAENGTFVVHKGKELFANTLPRDVAMKLIEIGRTIEDAYIILCGKKSAYIERSTPELLEQVDKYYARREIVEDLTQVDDEVLKVTILDFKGAEDNSNHFFSEYREQLQVAVSGFLWLDITNGDANKGTAIQKVQEYFGITSEQTMVFGDYLNDLDMMRQAYYSFAMANAHGEIKNVARFEAETNNEAGVMKSIRQYVLSK
ncbi:Cof-type HAD-IIB family hydrolase [Bacillus massiliigorillae]|uniref:Cof-type HAD-IIB family hydrolase n=1 Tax=Bacillus massiliigorillae TaxID=1243664 RepID=UPI0003A4FD08|nr:Cof-type HAD-IIB family hydrolase [Bacillus massiliigorillae]